MMKLRVVRLICITALWLSVSVAAHAQEYHQLTIDDFRGVPPYTNGAVIAYTNCSINFTYQAYHERNYYRLDFDIRLKLNNSKSWMDKEKVTSREMLAEILKHEQGHYLIAYMEQQELLRTVAKTIFYADYQYQAQSIFDRIDAKYKQINTNYDEDTAHMTNRAQQQSWDAYFKQRLAYMPSVRE